MAGIIYPFSAIVGQDGMKLALMLNVIDPLIGGVMVMGHRGTGKSTAVRSLAALLPRQRVVAGCPYGCDPDHLESACDTCRVQPKPQVAYRPVPVVDLPLGATEDRVTGTLDIEAALAHGVKRFDPGLLARANRGFLYIDEVNLLEDYLVDLLLDVAASGSNVVERESISVRHPARFVLVGSGNPEEGDLRPQLLDRFGLHAQIETITDLEQRVEIVKRRHAFERDPQAFAAQWEPEQEKLRRKIKAAQRLVAGVQISDALLLQVAQLCIDLGIDGHRGELTITRAACALAAFNRQDEVLPQDIRAVAPLALRHRLRKDPLDSADSGFKIDRAVEHLFGSTDAAAI